MVVLINSYSILPEHWFPQVMTPSLKKKQNKGQETERKTLLGDHTSSSQELHQQNYKNIYKTIPQRSFTHSPFALFMQSTYLDK